MLDLKEKVAFITGANRGIGKACALKLAKNGCSIAFLNRDETSAKIAQQEISALGVDCIYFNGDITDSSVVEKAVVSTIEKFAKIDFLVNNAGLTQDTLLVRMTEEHWDKVLNVNLKGLFFVSREVAKYMMKARSGRIINIGSVVGHTGNPAQVNYSSSKAALVGFTKSIALELAARNVLCNLISPGFIETDMTDKLTEQQKENILHKIPLKKMGTAENIANGVLFLCSPMSNYITGTTLHINGGLL